MAIVYSGKYQYVPTLSEFLVFKVFLQFSLQNSSQFFKVLVVQATVSHQLNALGGGRWLRETKSTLYTDLASFFFHTLFTFRAGLILTVSLMQLKKERRPHIQPLPVQSRIYSYSLSNNCHH